MTYERCLGKGVETMETLSGTGPIGYRPWLFGALSLLFLTACATSRLAEEGTASDSEAVEVGYGSVEKDHLSGSVTTLETEDVQAMHSGTFAQMLARVPGLQVTETGSGAVSVRIRGASSFLASQEPLFILDGIVFPAGGSGLAGISPSTVESITVLKDASETAIYGSRGANGVILIKTKRENN